MHRTIIQLDESLYERLRTIAFEKGQSLSGLIRDLLSKLVLKKSPKKKRRIDQFKFIGSGRSKEGDLSEEHDRYLAEDYLK